ncbi:MAG: VPS10 domain-containing protein [Sphingobacteriales bacterium]
MKIISRLKHSSKFLLITIYLFATTNSLYAQWVKTNKPNNAGVIQCFVTNGTNLFAGTFGNGVFLSTDDGVTWAPANTGITNAFVYALALNGTTLYAGTGGGVYISNNNGVSWTAMNNGLTNTFVVSFAFSGTNIFAGTDGGGVFLSTNNGASWNAVNSGLTNLFVHILHINGTNLFAGTDGGGMFLSTNNGTSWNPVNTGIPQPVSIFSLNGDDTNIFAGTDCCSSVFHSTDNGANWTAVNNGLSGNTIRAIALSGTNLFAATSSGGGVFLSTNNGTNWTAVNTGLTSTDIFVFAFSGLNVFIVTNTGDVWMRPLSEMVTVTAVEMLPNDGQPDFSLYQNYPNPLNSTTTISFSLPFKSSVTLKVFDAFGREVSTILNNKLPGGKYAVQWNAAGLASGTYFYKLQAGNFSKTRKLQLLKR